MSLRSPTEDENQTLSFRCEPPIAFYAMAFQVVTPERFNRWSSPEFLWIPAKSMRE